jgi:hypothetical protein
MRITTILVVLFLTMSPALGDEASDFLYVWAWDKAGDNGDFLAVIDVDEKSPTFGRIINSVSSGVAGFAHHTEHQMTDTTGLFANSFSAGKTFVFDMADPSKPSIVATIDAVNDFAFPHSFERLSNGKVLATFQRSTSRPEEPGGLVELDRNGNYVRGSSAVNNVDKELRPYSLAPLPQVDRVVSTSADMAGAHTGHSIQIWRLSDLSLLQTIFLPPGPRGDENENPSEVRVLDDGNTVIVVTFKCGMYLVENVATEPVVSFLRSFPWAHVGDDDTDCNLPVRVGKVWVQTIGTTGSLAVLNLENPRKPEIVSEFFFGVDARPHWISLEPNGNRIVMTGGGTLGGGVVLLEIDTMSGQLNLVESFRSPGHPFGLSFDRDEWPHGNTGPAYAHGAVFRKMPAFAPPIKPGTVE